MTNKVFLSLHGVIYGLFAIVLFFLPLQVWPLYGVQIQDQYAYFLSQHTSIFLGGIALVAWQLRELAQGEVAKKLILALLLTNLLGVAITTYAGVKGIFTGFGWSDPIFFAVMALLSAAQYRNQGTLYTNHGK
ncbi:hypothetical protein K0I63_15730 [Shewanella rhizosphaerae]|uniref:hypothetical protein n=1 Tax=Shewanella rhizosphaerae TaxID=2864207 RepID=UPI001C6568CD|nr:hypothetical protein [Shewanella rhizosphaerae]QYK12177.1 hypothetical protein K0I63_15730 [Shewanella rhizosphaerae]